MEESFGEGEAASELPSSYVKWRASRLGRTTDTLEQNLILRLIGPLAGLNVLDVGCGDGQLAASLARAGAKVSAIDPDARMLNAAGRNFTTAGVSVALDRGSVEALPYDDNTFDIVLAVTVLCLVQDPRGAITQMTRVLKPGGRLILGELGRRSSWAVWRRCRGWLGHSIWRSAHFFTEADLRELVRVSNLTVQTIRAAIFYPPLRWATRLLAPVDPWLGKHFVSGGRSSPHCNESRYAMSLSERELAKSREFGDAYRQGALPAMQAIERKVCGCDYGATSWATRDEADLIAGMLGLQPGVRMLEIGAGSGWPALYLAAS